MAIVWEVLEFVLGALFMVLVFGLLNDLFKAKLPAPHQWLSSYKGAAAARGLLSALCLALGLASLFAPGRWWPALEGQGDVVLGGIFVMAAVFFFVLLVHGIRQARIPADH